MKICSTVKFEFKPELSLGFLYALNALADTVEIYPDNNDFYY